METEFIESQKQKLLSEKVRLEQEVTQENIYPEMGTSMDDAAQETGELNDTNAITMSLSRELKAVKSALKRIEDGTYGKCQQCGGEINKERLIAYPAANRCVKCSNQ